MVPMPTGRSPLHDVWPYAEIAISRPTGNAPGSVTSPSRSTTPNVAMVARNAPSSPLLNSTGPIILRWLVICFLLRWHDPARGGVRMRRLVSSECIGERRQVVGGELVVVGWRERATVLRPRPRDDFRDGLPHDSGRVALAVVEAGLPSGFGRGLANRIDPGQQQLRRVLALLPLHCRGASDELRNLADVFDVPFRIALEDFLARDQDVAG